MTCSTDATLRYLISPMIVILALSLAWYFHHPVLHGIFLGICAVVGVLVGAMLFAVITIGDCVFNGACGS
jgi:hypothetical protein